MKKTTYHITVIDRDSGDKVELDTNALLLGVSASDDSNKGLYFVSSTSSNVEGDVLNMIQGVFYALNERLRTVDPLTEAYLMSLIHAAAAGEGFNVNPFDDDDGEQDGGAE